MKNDAHASFLFCCVFFAVFCSVSSRGGGDGVAGEFYSQVTRHRQLAKSFSAVVDTHTTSECPRLKQQHNTNNDYNKHRTTTTTTTQAVSPHSVAFLEWL